MKRTAWKKRIMNACMNAGTYRPYFDDIIDELAYTCEMRDEAQKQFKTEGKYAGKAVIEHTNKAGHTNITKNPALTIVVDLNTSILQHYKHLGIESKGVKAIDPNINDPFGGRLSDLEI